MSYTDIIYSRDCPSIAQIFSRPLLRHCWGCRPHVVLPRIGTFLRLRSRRRADPYACHRWAIPLRPPSVIHCHVLPTVRRLSIELRPRNLCYRVWDDGHTFSLFCLRLVAVSFVHRSRYVHAKFEEDRRLRERFGRVWDGYRQRVPYKFVPFVF